MNIPLFTSIPYFTSNSSSPLVKFATNSLTSHFLIKHSNNSLSYYNTKNSIRVSISEYRNTTVNSFLFLDTSQSLYVGVLFSNNELVLLSTEFIESDSFHDFWSQFSYSKFKKTTYHRPSNSFFGGIFFSCGGKSMLNSFITANNVIVKSINDYLKNEEEESLGPNSSCSMIEGWNQNVVFVTINNKILICLVDLLSKSNPISLLKLVTLPNIIYNIIVIERVKSLQYILIQTEENVSSLTLLDQLNSFSLYKNYQEIKLQETSIQPHSLISAQKLNQIDVVCILTIKNVFSVYDVYDSFTTPIISIDLNFKKFHLQNCNIVNCFIYSKLLLVISKEPKGFAISSFNIFSTTNDNKINPSNSKIESDLIWCFQDYTQLNDFEITHSNFSFDIIQYKLNSDENNNDSSSEFLVMNENSIQMLRIQRMKNIIQNIVGLAAENFDFEVLRRIEMLNSSLSGVIFERLPLALNEINKEKEILLKFIWLTENEKHLLDTIFASNDWCSYSTEFKERILQFLLMKLENEFDEDYLAKALRLFFIISQKEEFYNEKKEEIINYVKMCYKNKIFLSDIDFSFLSCEPPKMKMKLWLEKVLFCFLSFQEKDINKITQFKSTELICKAIRNNLNQSFILNDNSYILIWITAIIFLDEKNVSLSKTVLNEILLSKLQQIKSLENLKIILNFFLSFRKNNKCLIEPLLQLILCKENFVSLPFSFEKSKEIIQAEYSSHKAIFIPFVNQYFTEFNKKKE